MESKEKLQEEVDDHRRGYSGVMEQRVPAMRGFNFVPVYFRGGADIWGLMLIGIGLYKLGVLQGQRSSGFSVRMALISFGIGIPVNALSAYGMIASNFDLATGAYWNSPYQIGRVAVALGHASIVILIARGRVDAVAHRSSGRRGTDGVFELHLTFDHLRARLLCARPAVVRAVAAVSALLRRARNVAPQAWSPIWLRYFRFGPLEWCWRSLTYWRPQPMRRRALAGADGSALG